MLIFQGFWGGARFAHFPPIGGSAQCVRLDPQVKMTRPVRLSPRRSAIGAPAPSKVPPVVSLPAVVLSLATHRGWNHELR